MTYPGEPNFENAFSAITGDLEADFDVPKGTPDHYRVSIDEDRFKLVEALHDHIVALSPVEDDFLLERLETINTHDDTAAMISLLSRAISKDYNALENLARGVEVEISGQVAVCYGNEDDGSNKSSGILDDSTILQGVIKGVTIYGMPRETAILQELARIEEEPSDDLIDFGPEQMNQLELVLIVAEPRLRGRSDDEDEIEPEFSDPVDNEVVLIPLSYYGMKLSRIMRLNQPE